MMDRRELSEQEKRVVARNRTLTGPIDQVKKDLFLHWTEVIDAVMLHATQRLIALPVTPGDMSESAALEGAIKFLVNIRVVPVDLAAPLFKRMQLSRMVADYLIKTKHSMVIGGNQIPVASLEVCATYPVSYDAEPSIPDIVKRVEKYNAKNQIQS
jgi:hypothetical protein